jgi:Tol biopolymer transport system component
VSVKNADGSDIFTGVDQPYFWYRQILPYKAVSSVKRWQWLMPPTVSSFSFKVYVSTPLLPVVVFDRMVAGNVDVYRVALDGSDTVRLSTSLSDDMHPTAVGNKVVFMTYRDTVAELYSVPLGGGTETRLTFTKATESDPALSPDGTKIAFISDASGVGKLWTMNADGTGAARATASFSFSGSVEVAPSWFSNTRVAFVSTDLGTGDIYDLTLGGLPHVIIGGSFADLQPAVSPDGSRVAFVSNRNGDTEIYLYTVATGVVTRFTTRTGTDAQPTWLPDGRLVYSEFVSGTPHLVWADPSVPGVAHPIPTGTGAAQRPSGAQL